jgi:hypothetical protein
MPTPGRASLDKRVPLPSIFEIRILIQARPAGPQPDEPKTKLRNETLLAGCRWPPMDMKMEIPTLSPEVDFPVLRPFAFNGLRGLNFRKRTQFDRLFATKAQKRKSDSTRPRQGLKPRAGLIPPPSSLFEVANLPGKQIDPLSNDPFHAWLLQNAPTVLAPPRSSARGMANPEPPMVCRSLPFSSAALTNRVFDIMNARTRPAAVDGSSPSREVVRKAGRI